MPQLIAMIIIVVGAMIYMFQTFGGTGDKIEGIAQKSSVITEINNIKNGVQLALRSEAIVNSEVTEASKNNKVNSLKGISELEFFPEQINNQMTDTANTLTNTYQAISFGGLGNKTLEITLVLPKKTDADKTARPGLFVDISKGSLATNAGFLEKQLKTDLAALGTIDTNAIETTGYAKLKDDGSFLTAGGTAAGTNTDVDGKFTIYFKDLPRGMIKAE